MRNRTLKPEFWTAEQLAKLPDFTKLLALALLNLSDDEGLFWANLQLIHGTLFPFVNDTSAIECSLGELATCGYIRLGQTEDGRAVGQVVNFTRDQYVNRPKPSLIAPLARFAEQSSIAREPVSASPTTVALPPQQSVAATSSLANGTAAGCTAGDAWQEPPPQPPDGKPLSEAEVARAIRHRIGVAHVKWFGITPNMAASDFEAMVAGLLQQGWAPANLLLAVLGAWLWSRDVPAVSSEPGNPTPAFFSQLCTRNMRAVGKLHPKRHLPYVWYARLEVTEYAGAHYKGMFDNATLDDVDRWWISEMVRRRPENPTAPAPSPAPDKPSPASPATIRPTGKEANV